MSTVLLLLAGVMGLARRNQKAVSTLAVRYEVQAGMPGDERFVPRDLIRLCQFIEVWIPPK